jgi:hypothetical protein
MKLDDLDLDRFRLSQNFEAQVGIKKALLSVPLRKPHKHEFFRTHRDWAFPAPVFKTQGDRRDDLYIVTADLAPELAEDITPMLFVPTITRQDTVLLWPVRLPGPDGRQDEWSRTALEAASMAKTRWIRMAAKQSLGAYEVVEPVSTFPDPVWPDFTLEAILQIAIRDHVIEDRDHPALRRLRGEV